MARVLRFKLYLDARGEFRWSLLAGNNHILADSGEGYTTRLACQHNIDLVCSLNADTPVVEVTGE